MRRLINAASLINVGYHGRLLIASTKPRRNHAPNPLHISNAYWGRHFAALMVLVVAACVGLCSTLKAAEVVPPEQFQAFEEEVTKRAKQIEADIVKAIASLQQKGNPSEIEAGVDAAYSAWRKQTLQGLAESPRHTELGKKVISLYRDPNSGYAAWEAAETGLAYDLDSCERNLKSTLGSFKFNIGRVADNEKLFERLQENFVSATQQLARTRITVVQNVLERVEREITAERKVLAAEQAASDHKGSNLNDILKPFEGNLRAYVEYGSPDVADLAKGDRFDRMEAEKTAAKHRAALVKKQFVWTADEYRCRDDDDDNAKPSDQIQQTLMVYLPFRVADEIAIPSTHVKVGNGRNAVFGLMKDGSMQQLFDQRVIDEAEANNAALYIGEGETSFVQVVVKGKLEDIKRLVREPESHVVQFRLSKLAVRKPAAWGYYLKSAINKAKGHYPWVQASGLAQKAAGKDREGVTLDYISRRDVPELVMAQLDGIEVARIDGQKRDVLFSVEAKKPFGPELPP